MSKYTTGELAKACGVSVRTVQYYDTRGILIPSEVSEGGRRIYSEDDLGRMRIICFLRELELPIDSIREILSEDEPEAVIHLLLEQQEKQLRQEISEKQQRADRITEVRRTLRTLPSISARSIGDIAHIMESKAKLRRLHITMLIVGLIMDAIQAATLMLWILTGRWQPFAWGMLPVIALGVWISSVYYRKTAYLCPHCHTVFHPRFREAFFARHTPCTRKLTCPHCSHHGYCVETYRKDDAHAAH